MTFTGNSFTVGTERIQPDQAELTVPLYDRQQAAIARLRQALAAIEQLDSGQQMDKNVNGHEAALKRSGGVTGRVRELHEQAGELLTLANELYERIAKLNERLAAEL